MRADESNVHDTVRIFERVDLGHIRRAFCFKGGYMYDFAASYAEWKQGQCLKVDVRELRSRSPAHKWKGPWRLLLLRECCSWRLSELLNQADFLYSSDLILGARILLRSALETLAMLVYSSQAMCDVVAGKLNFHDFSDKTEKLVLGTRDNITGYVAINILSVLKKVDQRYPGIASLYAGLCETAHPNCEGMLTSYSESDADSLVTVFGSRWQGRYGNQHEIVMSLILETFMSEYNDEWPVAFEALEQWLVANDAMLESTRPKTAPP